MVISKIKAVKSDFHEGAGPSETVTLGFAVETNSDANAYILGSFYYGPGMSSEQAAQCENVEAFIDYIVAKCKA